MKLLDNLHKLGILRVGATGGTYKNVKDMPDELMFDNVYDKEKDLAGGKGAIKSEDASLPGKQPSGRSSGLLFAIMFVVSLVITLFFGLMVDLGPWFFALVGILLVFLFMLYRYLRGLLSQKAMWIFFLVFIIFSVAVLFIAIPTGEEEEGEAAATFSQSETGAASQAANMDESKWIDYTGVKSPLFTFRYPESYTIEEYGTSTLLYVDKEAEYDYHVTFTVLDSAIPTGIDCEGEAKGVVERYGGEVRYAKSRDFFGYKGCEYGINLMQDGEMFYEINYSFATADRTFYVTSYAMQLSDLDILSKIMQSFKLN